VTDIQVSPAAFEEPDPFTADCESPQEMLGRLQCRRGEGRFMRIPYPVRRPEANEA
jgi:hypothetical protein